MHGAVFRLVHGAAAFAGGLFRGSVRDVIGGFRGGFRPRGLAVAFGFARRLPLRRLFREFLFGGSFRRLFRRGLLHRLFAAFGREHVELRVGISRQEGLVELLIVFAGAVFVLEIGAEGLVVKRREDAGVALAVEVAEDFVVSAEEAQPAVPAQEGDLVALVEVLHRVGDDDDGAPLHGEVFEQIHHLEVEVGGEPARRLVEEDDLGVGEQFHGDGHPLALSAGEGGDLQVFPPGEAHVGDGFLDALSHLRLGHVGAHAQHSGVEETLRDGEVVVHDVLLGDVAHHGLVGLDVVVIVVGVVIDAASRCGTDAVEAVQEGGFPRAGAAHDGDE